MDLKSLVFGSANRNKAQNVQDDTSSDSEVNSTAKKEVTSIAKESKKIKKPKKSVNPGDVKVKYIGYYHKLKPSEKCKRRYKCEVIYEQDGKEHRKQVRFGNADKKEFVDDHDNAKRLSIINKLGHTDDPLHPNFYRMYLLNSIETDIDNAYINLVKNMGL